jgi:hypothetical protein
MHPPRRPSKHTDGWIDTKMSDEPLVKFPAKTTFTAAHVQTSVIFCPHFLRGKFRLSMKRRDFWRDFAVKAASPSFKTE